MQYLTQDELLAVLKVARKEGVRDWLMILMAYNHGMRASEVVNVKLEDIRNNHIVIRRLKGSKVTTQPLEAHPGKPLLDEVRGLELWRAERPRLSGALLFPVRYKTFYRAFVRYAQLANLPKEKCHPHVLKHTVATFMTINNISMPAIQAKLGHASITSTAMYTHVSDARAAEVFHDMMMEMF